MSANRARGQFKYATYCGKLCGAQVAQKLSAERMPRRFAFTSDKFWGLATRADCSHEKIECRIHMDTEYDRDILPAHFCRLNSIPYDIRYATSNNFMGRPLAGYKANKCIVTTPVAEALERAQKNATSAGLSLMIFETYRPLKSLEDILQWMLTDDVRNPEADRFFPNLNKAELLNLGYISLRSSHTRGGAVDVTLIDEYTGLELNMGTEFDFFGDTSHTSSRSIPQIARKNRKTLVTLMEASGFANYEKEWWHFNLKEEPFPHTYFDFDII